VTVTAPAALYQVKQGVGLITFNRPHPLNAANAEPSTAVDEALQSAAPIPRSEWSA
jgi:enoyl-CoA hydratase/carnithine racemase